MKFKEPSERVVMLDACVLINILSTGQAEDILSTEKERFAICSVVKAESIFLRPIDSKDPSEAVSIDSLIEGNCISVCDLAGSAEETLYLDYATELDDGEAMSLALADSRGFSLATDDRKARRLFLERTHAPARLLSTAGVLRTWARRRGIPREKLKAILLLVTTRARFIPGPQDPDYSWWARMCS